MSTSMADKTRIAQGAVRSSSKRAADNLTPSWTSIVDAYHKEGNGDREMLLALLHAKAKEDERLAALDLLRAEQMRAYSTHLAVHGPMFVQTVPVAGMQPYAMPPMPAHTHAQPQVQAQPAPRASVASTSSHRSRAPSLSNSVGTSRSSSSPLLSPEEEGSNRTLANANSSAGGGVVIMSARDHTAYNTLALPALNGSGSMTSSAQRKRPRASIEDENEHAAALRAVSATITGAGALKSGKAKAARTADASRRTSPTLPGIRSLDLPPLDPHAHAHPQRMPAFHSSTRSPPRPSSSAQSQSQVQVQTHYRSAPARSAEHDGAASEAVAAAAKGLQHLLNSGTSTRVATSDMRSSSASDEE